MLGPSFWTFLSVSELKSRNRPRKEKWPRLAAFGPVRDKLIDLAVERYVRISLCSDGFCRRYVLVFLFVDIRINGLTRVLDDAEGRDLFDRLSNQSALGTAS